MFVSVSEETLNRDGEGVTGSTRSTRDGRRENGVGPSVSRSIRTCSFLLWAGDDNSRELKETPQKKNKKSNQLHL